MKNTNLHRRVKYMVRHGSVQTCPLVYLNGGRGSTSQASLAAKLYFRNYPSPPSIAPFPKHFCQEKKIEEFSSDNKNCPRGRKGGSRSIESAEQTKDKMIIFLENWWAAHPSCFANVKIQTSRLIGGLTWKLAWPGLTDPRHPIQIALQAKPFELRI